MQKPSKALSSKDLSKKPRGRNGGRTPLPEKEKAVEIHVSLPKWLEEAFKKLVPKGIDRSRLIIGWVRAYCIAEGESNRLLAQSPLAGRLLNYLEAQDTEQSQELAEKLQLLIVARDFDEAKLEEAIKVGDSYII